LSTVGGATGLDLVLGDGLPYRLFDQLAGHVVLDLGLVELLDQRPRHLAGAETLEARLAAELIVGLLQLGGDVAPGNLEIHALLHGEMSSMVICIAGRQR
jgi:hypothetical protein